MRKILVLFFFTLIIFLACKTTQPISLVPDAQDEEFAKGRWSGTDLTQLNSGYKIYNEKCQSCHSLHKPTEYDEAGWTKIIPWMGKKAFVNEADQQLILHYLLSKREVMKKTKK